jgi:hypothetical protein
MSELILGLTILALLATNAWTLKQFHSQEKRLVKALLSKDLADFTSAELAEKPSKKVKEEEELIPLSDLDDDQFKKMIDKQRQRG